MPIGFRLPALATAAVAGALAVLASAVPVRAEEQPEVEPVWIEDRGPGGEGSRTIPALLDLPQGWRPGDAAVVVVADAPWPARARETLVALLLGEGAAVLELDTNTARGFGPESPGVGPEPTAAELAADVRAAVEHLRRDTGAGLVVALGHGAGGAAAVLAASLERTATGRADRAGMAAAASLGPGPARFALGGAAPGRGWPARAGRLCAVLAAVAAPADARAEEAECERALTGPPARIVQAGNRPR